MTTAKKPLKEIMRQARELALNLLFQADVTKISIKDAANTATEHAKVSTESLDIGIELALGAWEYAWQADRLVTKLAPDWPTDRQPSVDRNILRLAFYEMDRKGTPAAVVIDEAIELAKIYSTLESSKFINGVLAGAQRHRATPPDSGNHKE
ncbi:MAG: transcription antitermination factor NusB [Armatimonadota bacterium]